MRASICLGLSLSLLTSCTEKEEEEICVPLATSFPASTTLPRGCYLAERTPTLAAGVKLTLDPGVRIIFSAGTGLGLADDQILSAIGTEDLPILLTGASKTRGSWKGLSFSATQSAENRLEWVTVEYGGNTASDRDAAGIKATADSRGVVLSLAYTTVQESQGFGLYLAASAQTPVFTSNTFTKNTLGPVNVDSEVAGLLDPVSTFTGNTVDRIVVRAQNLTKNGAWAALDAPYYVKGPLGVSIPWTIAAGTTLIMAPQSRIDLESEAASLVAVGNAMAPILFTGEDKTRGSWTGLTLATGLQSGHQLEYVTVEYAGNISYTHDNDSAGIKAIADSRGVVLSLVHTTVRQSAGWGLYLTGSAVINAFADNTFTENTLGPVSVGSEAVWQLDTSSDYTGNDVDQVRVRDRYISKTATWLDLGVPYDVATGLAVNGNQGNPVTWTISPGVALILPAGAYINVSGDYSMLSAVGTPDRLIRITGADKTNGFWKSIVFDNSNTSNVISYATVEYGGMVGGGGETGMIQAQSDSRGVTLSVTHTTIQHSGQYGIFWGGSATGDIVTGNTFLDNTAGDVYQQTF